MPATATKPATAPTPDAADVREKFAAARAALAKSLVERDGEVDLVLTALVAREHVLLVGPPGCAKSLLLDSVMGWAGGAKFAVLLTKFTTPEEVVGPVSLAGLRADKFVRVTTGKLPEAEFAFVDEVFKASSAILNTLLKILNERTFDPGDGVVRTCPLRLCVAASNEWPCPETGKELAALFDRFTFRRAVRPVATRAGRARLLWAATHAPTFPASVTAADLDRAHAAAMAVPWSAEGKEALETVLRELAKEGVHPGDRRQVKAVAAAKAAAWLAGAAEVEPEHLEVLAAVLWDDPVEQPETCAQVIAKVANPTGMRVTQLLLEVEQVLAGTDVRNLGQAATAAAKLGEIDRQLARLSGNGRLAAARAYVKDQVKAIKLASLEAV